MRGKDASGVGQHAVAQFGERDAATGLLDDRAPDDGLDPADVLADGRLGQVQDRRGAVKSATVGHRDDAAQRCDVQDLGHPPRYSDQQIRSKSRVYGVLQRSYPEQSITIRDRSRSPIFVGLERGRLHDGKVTPTRMPLRTASTVTFFYALGYPIGNMAVNAMSPMAVLVFRFGLARH